MLNGKILKLKTVSDLFEILDVKESNSLLVFVLKNLTNGQIVKMANESVCAHMESITNKEAQ